MSIYFLGGHLRCCEIRWKLGGPEPWRSHWTSTTRQEYLSAGETEARLAVIRQRTHTGRPLGTEEFIQDLEKATQRRIALQKRGPREKIVTDRRQGELSFDP